jgi:hypothetical protein
LPEVAGALGVYVDIDDPRACRRTIERLITDAAMREQLEKRISEEFGTISWESVAQRVLEGCAGAAAVQWQEPHPLPQPAYGRELSFGRIDVEADGLWGDDLLDAVARSRKSHFVSNGLDRSSFSCAEDAPISGRWGGPENWGSWISYPGGEIAVGLPATDCAAGYLFLRCHVAAPLCQEEVSIFVNGDRLWRGILEEEPTDLCLKIYKRNGPAQWSLRIGIWAPEKSELYDALLKVDQQAPHRLVLVPEDDIQ